MYVISEHIFIIYCDHYIVVSTVNVVLLGKFNQAGWDKLHMRYERANKKCITWGTKVLLKWLSVKWLGYDGLKWMGRLRIGISDFSNEPPQKPNIMNR